MTDLVGVLTNNPAVSALVGTRIYHMRLPKTPQYPLIVYQNIVTSTEYTQSGRSHLNPRWQFVCWSDSDLEASQVASAVENALSMAKTNTVKVAFIGNRIERYETDTKLYSQVVEISAIV